MGLPTGLMVEDENGVTWELPILLDEIAEKIDDAHELYLNMLLYHADPLAFMMGCINGTDLDVYEEIYNEKS